MQILLKFILKTETSCFCFQNKCFLLAGAFVFGRANSSFGNSDKRKQRARSSLFFVYQLFQASSNTGIYWVWFLRNSYSVRMSIPALLLQPKTGMSKK